MNFPDLNPQQKSAVRAPEKPLLIVAGAGTGKTRTLTSRLLYLIGSGISPRHIVAITFTNKAAKEMAKRVLLSTNNEFFLNERIRKFAPHSIFADASPFIGTFHSFGARILRSEARHLGRTPNFVIFDSGDSLQLIKKIMKALGAETRRGSRDRGPVYFAQKISRLKNGIIDASELQHSATKDVFALEVFERYERELLKQNAFDFDDLIGKVGDVFREHPEVLEKYRKRFQYVLVDEYQDLNNCQYELIRLLVGDSARISVVGDDQQMIYSFRGSNFNIFLDFENDWPDANVIFLEENYRSTANIIKASSALIRQNTRQKPKNLWTKNEEGTPVKIAEAEDEDVEAEWIAEQVNRLISELVNLNKKIKTNQPINQLTSIAILYRTNAQSRAIEQALIERSIPYRIFGGLRFYERKEIKDIVAALRLVQNPKDEVSRERLEKNLSKGRFMKFREFIKEGKDVSPQDLTRIFLETTGYLELLERNFPNSDDRKENIAELLNFASGFTELAPFLEQIALLQPADSLQSQESRVKGQESEVHLMTIHLAKGLEFDTVFVAGCNEGILPHGRSLGSEAEIEEERRLMYVAMTRAKKELNLSFYDIPSRFLGELPAELTEFESLNSENQKILDIDSEERYITLD